MHAPNEPKTSAEQPERMLPVKNQPINAVYALFIDACCDDARCLRSEQLCLLLT
jgi:hypothetical protein